MALGTTTYTSVTWTTGDTITEAKLDNMVANDQAYDSHAAEGLLLNNNVGYYQKDTGGNNRPVLNVDTNDDLNVGDSNLGDVILRAGASNVMAGQLVRKNINTASYDAKQTIESGWDYIEGNGTATLSKTVTFPKAFANPPIVLIGNAGARSTNTPTTIDDLNVSGVASFAGGIRVLSSHSVTNTTFVFTLVRDSGTFTSGTYYGFNWIAVGEIS